MIRKILLGAILLCTASLSMAQDFTCTNIDDLHDYSITAVYANGVESEPVSIVTNPAGISTVTMDGKVSFRFNLAGQRISRNAKGVVIENGRKVVVK